MNNLRTHHSVPSTGDLANFYLQTRVKFEVNLEIRPSELVIHGRQKLDSSQAVQPCYVNPAVRSSEST